MIQQKQLGSVSFSATATIPELQQSKTAVLDTLASRHSRRSYEYAIDRFIASYCSEPRLEFNRSVVVRYRSFLERLSLSAATINLHLSAIRRLADESERNRIAVTRGKFLQIDGTLQNQDGVINIRASAVRVLNMTDVDRRSRDFH